ncbi:MAG: methyltransferase domain-containing protein [candidate division Zixibacteria bacterium]|nr:methyltransferase domain-containing protein [candidate division Zixibacteria bacterium]
MQTIYEDGTYLRNNPTWGHEDAHWKAMQVVKIIENNNLKPRSICDIGCGVGEVLKILADLYDDSVKLDGFEISRYALEICEEKVRDNLRFYHQETFAKDHKVYDIIMAIDVLEHVEDCFSFLRSLKDRGRYKIFHIPLELSAQSVLRVSPLLKERREVGHIHYFTRETALATVEDAGYKIIDWFYTSRSTELPVKGWKANLMRMPRKMFYRANRDIAARLLGGYSLLVLAS